jgi:hypothetical protein
MMRNRIKRLQQIIDDCYRELYQEASPSADFDILMENAPLDEMGRKVIDFNSYYLPSEKFESVVEKHRARMKMEKYEEMRFNFAVYLGPSPTSKEKEINKEV